LKSIVKPATLHLLQMKRPLPSDAPYPDPKRKPV
jgi:hypothetical protein